MEPPIWNRGCLLCDFRASIYELSKEQNIITVRFTLAMNDVFWIGAHGLRWWKPRCAGLWWWTGACRHYGRNPIVQVSKLRLSLIVTLSSTDPEKDMHTSCILFKFLYACKHNSHWWIAFFCKGCIEKILPWKPMESYFLQYCLQGEVFSFLYLSLRYWSKIEWVCEPKFVTSFLKHSIFNTQL